MMPGENQYDDGVAGGKFVRLVSLTLLGIGGVLILIPPSGVLAIVSMILVMLGFWRIYRKQSFPNAWWFWFLSAIAFVQNSGAVFPITKFEIPTRTLPVVSYYLSCVGAIISVMLGMVMFLRYAWTDLRAGRIRFEDD